MSRFAEALNRARTGSIPEPDDDRTGGAIRFFAPGQPAVISPWDVEREPPAPPPPDPPKPLPIERRPPVRFPEREQRHDAPAQFPSPRSSDKLVASPEVTAVVREQYNKLAAAVHQSQLERSLKVVMITSAAPSEGKTLTAANLALALSESYQRQVLLIDSDLRHPSLHSAFGVSNSRGLSDSLITQGALPLISITPGLSLLTAGSLGGDPLKTLTSDRMRALIDDARIMFDWVLVDTAPIGLLPDARLVAAIADGTLFVIRARQTAYHVVQQATETIGADRILGVVLNGVAEHDVFAGYYYGDYYGAINS